MVPCQGFNHTCKTGARGKPNYDKTNTTFNQEIETIESTVEQLVGPSDPKQPEKGSLTLQVGEINNPIGRRLLDEKRNTVRNIKKEMSNNNNVSKSSEESEHREWSTVVIVIVIFIS